MLSAGSAAGKQSQDFSLNTANGAPVAPPPATSNKLNNIPPETAEATAGNAFKTAAELNKIACLKYLLPHAFEKSIEEALTTSASYGHLEVVKFLTSELERRNLLNDSTLDKPLLVCIRYGKLECFQFLILKCQDVQNVVKNCVKKCVSCRFHFPTEESLRLALPATFIRHTEWLLQIFQQYNQH